MIAAALVALIVADFSTAKAQNDDETAGRIVARLLDDGRVEFGWQPSGGERVLPRQRYFPTDATVDRWLRSSPVEVGGAEIGRINARLLGDGRIEFAFTPTDGERITPQARYFPAGARVGRWLRSTEIAIGQSATRYIAISATNSSYHTCAIREDKSLSCWGGWNHHGQADTPEGSFTAVSAGNAHTCAIRESGELECWGSNASGQVDAPEGSYSAVSTGFELTCAIRTSGEIACWGDNRLGQTDAPDGRFTAVSVGRGHICAIRDSDAIECWGANRLGQTDAPDGRFTAVSAGFAHTCAIRTSGEIACWGWNEKYAGWNAETQEHEYANAGQATPPAGAFTAVSAGEVHTCGLRENGEATCWGDNERGQIDAPEGSFTAISAGTAHNCVLRDTGVVECWGDNEYGQTDTPTESGQQPYTGPHYTAVSAGENHTCAIRESGEITCWGSNEDWDGQYVGQSDPPPGTFIAVSASPTSPLTCGLRDTGAIECWGDTSGVERDPPTGSYTAISTSWFSVCGLRETGETDCGVRGEPSTSRFSAVTDSTGGTLNNAFHACAIRERDGAIECWGDNRVGQHMFNEETGEHRIEYLSVGQATPPAGAFTAVSAGIAHTCGLRTSGEIACWGDNRVRQTDAPEGRFTAISMDTYGGCGLRSDGEIRCWGEAFYSSKPIGRYTAISVGGGHACAIRDTGAIRCWGANSDGQTDVPTE